MQVFVIGVEYSRGTAKETGKPYEISKIYYGAPLQNPVNTPARVSFGHGLRPAELTLSTDALAQFERVKLPALLDIVIEPDPRNMQRNLCVGIRAADSK